MENESMNPALLANIAGAAGTNVPANQAGEKVANPVDEKASLKGKAQVATARYAQKTRFRKKCFGKPSHQKPTLSRSQKTAPSELKAPPEGNLFKKTRSSQKPLPDYSKSAVTNTDSKGAIVVPASDDTSRKTKPDSRYCLGPGGVVQASHSQTPDVFTANQMSAHQNQVEDKSVKEIAEVFKRS